LLKKLDGWRRRAFGVFAGLFEGGPGKNACLSVVFDGKNVVKCVVKRGELTALKQARKTCHFSDFIFAQVIFRIGARGRG
jgi:hypothetical protein